MGTGVGELALLQAMGVGAATGAASSALTGGDPLKGALFGAVGGAVMPGLGSALGGTPAGAVAGAAPGTVAQTALQSALPEAAVQTAASAAPASAVPGSFQAALSDLGVKSATETAAQNALNPNLVSTAGSSTGAITPTTGFSDIFKSTPGGPDFGTRVGNYIIQNPNTAAMTGSSVMNMFANQPEMPEEEKYRGALSKFRYSPFTYRPTYMADGGIADAGIAGTERNMFPQSQFDKTQYATPSQMPTSAEVIASDYEPRVNPYTGVAMASGGIADLGSYSDGGRLLKGPGDGMSDSIPASIGRKQPARLADGEFVVPADVVSHLGNGSTDAGAKQLYAMMDKVRKARTGNKKQGKEINPRKFVPA